MVWPIGIRILNYYYYIKADDYLWQLMVCCLGGANSESSIGGEADSTTRGGAARQGAGRAVRGGQGSSVSARLGSTLTHSFWCYLLCRLGR